MSPQLEIKSSFGKEKNHTLYDELKFSDLTHSGKHPYTQTLNLELTCCTNTFHPNSYCYILHEEVAFFRTETSTSCCWDVEKKAGGGKKGLMVEPPEFAFPEPK